MKGYTSHNPYDSYIPEDRGMTGFAMPSGQKSTVMKKRPSTTFQMSQFEDYESQIGRQANPQPQASRVYQANPSPVRSIHNQASVMSRVARPLNQASTPFNQSVSSHLGNTSSVQTFQGMSNHPSTQNMGIRKSYLNKGGRKSRVRVGIIKEDAAEFIR